MASCPHPCLSSTKYKNEMKIHREEKNQFSKVKEENEPFKRNKLNDMKERTQSFI